MATKKTIAIGCLLAAAAPSWASMEALADARAATREWARTERALSREAAEWASDKALLKDLIEVAKGRIEALEAELAEGEETLSAAEERRAKLFGRQEEVAALEGRIEAYLESAEDRLRALKPRLPEPLREELSPLFRKLGQAGASGAATAGERMRTVTALIGRIRQFDGRVTVSESQRARSGGEGEVAARSLWLGLGQGFYLAPGEAGAIVYGPEGWEWRSRPELAERIAEAIALAEGERVEPRWIDLPVTLQGGGRP